MRKLSIFHFAICLKQEQYKNKDSSKDGNCSSRIAATAAVAVAASAAAVAAVGRGIAMEQRE